MVADYGGPAQMRRPQSAPEARTSGLRIVFHHTFTTDERYPVLSEGVPKSGSDRVSLRHCYFVIALTHHHSSAPQPSQHDEPGFQVSSCSPPRVYDILNVSGTVTSPVIACCRRPKFDYSL
eukprot:sb/3476082/